MSENEIDLPERVAGFLISVYPPGSDGALDDPTLWHWHAWDRHGGGISRRYPFAAGPSGTANSREAAITLATASALLWDAKIDAEFGPGNDG